MPNATTIHPTPGTGGLTADRIFALGGGGVLIVAGLLILARVATAILSPAPVYEATATFALSPAAGAPEGDGLQAAWKLLPANAAVGLEPDGSEPRAYRLSYRSPDPAQVVAQTNAIVTGMQDGAKHPGMGVFQVIHPADHVVTLARSRTHEVVGNAVLLLLALLPIFFGLRLAFRHRPTFTPSNP